MYTNFMIIHCWLMIPGLAETNGKIYLLISTINTIMKQIVKNSDKNGNGLQIKPTHSLKYYHKTKYLKT